MFPKKLRDSGWLWRQDMYTCRSRSMRSQAVRAWLLLLSLGLGLKFATSKRWGIARPKRDGRGSPWDKIVLSDQPFSQEAAPPGPLLGETQQRKKTWALKRPKSVNRYGRTAPRATRRRTHNPGSSVQEPSQHTFRHRVAVPYLAGRPVTHTSAYVSIRQHTSAYVSIRQHTRASSGSCGPTSCPIH